MSTQQAGCFHCGAPITAIDGRVGRRDTCPKCGADMHCCKNCTFYDIKSYNECRERQADRVVDKEKSNFCDYFVLHSGSGGSSAPSKDDVMKKLDDLFKK